MGVRCRLLPVVNRENSTFDLIIVYLNKSYNLSTSFETVKTDANDQLYFYFFPGGKTELPTTFVSVF